MIKKILILSVVVSFISVGLAKTSFAAEEFQAPADKDLISFARFVDQTAKENIQQVYLPNSSDAYKVSVSKKLSHQEKQTKLYAILKVANESLEAQRNETGFIFISPVIRYKLNQFQSAIAVGDFGRTAQMAKSAHSIAKALVQ